MSFYRTYREFLAERFPTYRHVRKVTLDAGFTCPNLDGTVEKGGCSYCDNRSFSPANALRGELVQTQLAEQSPRILHKFPGAGILAYFQAYTNTYGPVERLEELYHAALEYPGVVGLSIGTRPDCLPNEVLQLLCRISRIKPLILEVGLQTANDASLLRMNRGHDSQCFADAMQRIAKCVAEERAQGFAGFDVGTHLIVGLPGEGIEDFKNTAKFIAAFDLAAVKIHPLHIVRNTRLAREWERGEFTLLAFEEYCQGVVAMLRELPKSIAIERFTGDAPADSLLAPTWCGDRNAIVKRVEEILKSEE